jgi:hypothetical protein
MPYFIKARRIFMELFSYRIYDKVGKFFPIEFEFEENAQKVCDFLSKRDNEQYIVKRFYYLVGTPDYNDDLINQIL